jgi:signal recognition particle GTPase
MAVPLERVLDSDLNQATSRLSIQAVKAQQELEAHDHKVEDMRWYERVFTYLERREDRAELIKKLDRALIRAEVAHEVADVVHEAVKQYRQAVERESGREREPQREQTRERERPSRSRGDDFGREL